jgi:hypothetical protein
VIFLFGMAVAGAGLGVLLSFDRSVDGVFPAQAGGTAVGLGLGMAIFAILTRDRE